MIILIKKNPITDIFTMNGGLHFISTCVDNFLNLFNRQNGRFLNIQSKGSGTEIRISSKDTVQEWFKRAAEECGGIENVYTLDSKIALFPYVKIKECQIEKMSIQILVPLNYSVADYYLKILDKEMSKECDVVYLRLDYHPYESGKLFSHTMPHIHISNKYDVRVPFSLTSPQTCLLDFLEFLYVNFLYETWIYWVQDLWESKLNMHKLDPYKSEDYFLAIQNGFSAGKIHDKKFIECYGGKIVELKKLLFDRKSKIAKQLYCVSSDCSLINYIGTVLNA